MIKLNLTDKPVKLTDELVEELTKKYLSDGSDVWNRSFIRESVLGFSNSKCCYTECKLNSESKYMEVDHFHPKIHFPNDVVLWGNLLPSCKKSNTTKGELNTKLNPIINPIVDDPKEHLRINGFRFYHKSEIGRRTIDYTALNDRQHFVNKRFEIGIKIIELIEDIYLSITDLAKDIKNNHHNITRIINKYKSLLKEADRKEEYAATISTTILMDSHNTSIIDILKSNDLWDDELENLLVEINFCSLCD
ncbi:HNH endonuclease [Flavobacterium sp. LHD-80]|uniref:HNH endonuclease n=1 Tax=Flavobacterium sp. LHD-80 TaxID=3071411 RepID=UPI0027E1DD5A|nr:HNH endonuclease [Flavobacterium sp. LHD-80]MDQ6469075.1 HNH endonuclease [Flavobacterium sp. LHD-80]